MPWRDDSAASQPASVGERGDHVAAVRLDRLVLAGGHQADVPRVDAGGFEAAKLLEVSLGRAEETAACTCFVGDLLAVAGVPAAVLGIAAARHPGDRLGESRR